MTHDKRPVCRCDAVRTRDGRPIKPHHRGLLCDMLQDDERTAGRDDETELRLDERDRANYLNAINREVAK